jgi:hypothetical protein
MAFESIFLLLDLWACIQVLNSNSAFNTAENIALQKQTETKIKIYVQNNVLWLIFC